MAKKRYKRKDLNSPTITIDEYRKVKIAIIEEDMYINLTEKQKAHFDKLVTEIQIDNYARKIIFDTWGDD